MDRAIFTSSPGHNDLDNFSTLYFRGKGYIKKNRYLIVWFSSDMRSMQQIIKMAKEIENEIFQPPNIKV